MRRPVEKDQQPSCLLPLCYLAAVDRRELSKLILEDPVSI